MSFERKDERLDIQLSSSIKIDKESKRNFCIIRNISRNGVFLTAKVRLYVGLAIECIISFNEQSILFKGFVRRAFEADELGAFGYGIEITEISEENEIILNQFVSAGYLPEMQ